MTEIALTKRNDPPSNGMMKRLTILSVCALCLAQTACVNVTAPDKPIVINLNISVTQEVVYRLDGQAKNLIQSQPGIF